MKIIKVIPISLIITVLTCICAFAGEYNITTSPSSQWDPNSGWYYLATTKSWATSAGINFSISATPFEGTVGQWNWSFENGTPNSSTTQNPTGVTFGAAAYGQSNLCSITFVHNGSNSELCSTPNGTVWVSIMKPFLNLNFSTTPTSGDTLPSTMAGPYKYSSSPIPLGVVGTYTDPGLGLVIESRPYELIETLQPLQSGAASSNMQIQEGGQGSVFYYAGNNVVAADSPAPYPGTYSVANGDGYGVDLPIPQNPTFYGLDLPGCQKARIEAILTQNSTYTKAVCKENRIQTPQYLPDNNNPDIQQSVNTLNTVVVTATKNANGQIVWN